MVTFMIDFAMFPYTENTTWHSEDCSLIATILPGKSVVKCTNKIDSKSTSRITIYFTGITQVLQED